MQGESGRLDSRLPIAVPSSFLGSSYAPGKCVFGENLSTTQRRTIKKRVKWDRNPARTPIAEDSSLLGGRYEPLSTIPLEQAAVMMRQQGKDHTL